MSQTRCYLTPWVIPLLREYSVNKPCWWKANIICTVVERRLYATAVFSNDRGMVSSPWILSRALSAIPAPSIHLHASLRSPQNAPERASSSCTCEIHGADKIRDALGMRTRRVLIDEPVSPRLPVLYLPFHLHNTGRITHSHRTASRSYTHVTIWFFPPSQLRLIQYGECMLTSFIAARSNVPLLVAAHAGALFSRLTVCLR